MSLKRTLEDCTSPSPNTLPTKRRKLEKQDTKEPQKVDFTKYQHQKVREFDIKGCVHKTCYPPNTEIDPTIDYNIDLYNKDTLTFPYKLDIFQSRSITCVECNDNVLVAAHTSAGKTTVAEYAIARALKQNSRVIYTSPIKALSNQKYRELNGRLGDGSVGIMTGDICINRNANCLVMTTEILRNMLYRGSQMLREISWVIFDEIHYMNDRTRGVVWEETLILLSNKLRFIFLSATIPNSVQFAKWIAKLNGNVCHVIYTDMRPVPLQHYIFPNGANGIYLVVDHECNFKQHNFQKALNKIKSPMDSNLNKRKMKNDENSDIFKLIKMVTDREFDPCIVFAFSKKQVESLAINLSKLDFCSLEEKKLIYRIFNNAMETLSENDKKLPQLTSLIHFLQRGIGIHHAGLLPLLKEIVEILFGEGLIKVLFTTETFAMGVNFPAKCVIFSEVRKWDGFCNRLLTCGEYVQMSGRAGRRGLDERGVVIMMCNARLEPFQLQQMLSGSSDRLLSQFRLTYQMLLQLKRIESAEQNFSLSARVIMERSFMHFQMLAKIPELQNKINVYEKEYESIVFDVDESEISVYYDLQQSMNALYVQMIEHQNKPCHILQWLNSGRLLHICQKSIDWGWAVCLNWRQMSKKDNEMLKYVHKNKQLNIEYVVDVLLKKENKYQIISVQLHHIRCLSKIRINLETKLNTNQYKKEIGMKLDQVLLRFKQANKDIPILHPIIDMNIKNTELEDIMNRMSGVKGELVSITNISDSIIDKYHKKQCIADDISRVREAIAELENNDVIIKRLAAMNTVLNKLKMFENGQKMVTDKGKVACEISCCDELVCTQLIFDGVFQNMEPPMINALLSCFVFEDKKSSSNGKNVSSNANGSQLSDDLKQIYDELRKRVLFVCNIFRESELEKHMNIQRYVESFGNGMMKVAYAWTTGASFDEIMKITQIYEGSIVRVMRRLFELLQELMKVAQLIGNDQLFDKFQTCRKNINRDIIFSSSLYL